MGTVKSINPGTTPKQGIIEQDGLSVAQYRLVLETIAGRMATLQRLIMLSNGPTNDDFVRDTCGDAADILAASRLGRARLVSGRNRFGSTPNPHANFIADDDR